MKTTFNIWETSRKNYLDHLNNFSIEELNKIPKGFNNNIIWNIGHIVVVQQALVYKSSGLAGYITDDLFNLYKPGTAPLGLAQPKDIIELKELLISLVEKTKTDYSNCLFTSFGKLTVGTGFHLETIEDALAFNNYHEAIHIGYILNIKKFI